MAVTDDPLGLRRSILRRDYLYGSLLSETTAAPEVSPAAVLARQSGLTIANAFDYFVRHKEDVVRLGSSASREAIEAQDTGEVFDLVVVGGGLSGLAAAYYLRQAREEATVLILENHEMFGGNARREEFSVDGEVLYAPQASTVVQDLSPALAPSEAAAGIFGELGIALEQLRVPEDQYFFGVFRDEKSHGVAPRWYPNIFEDALAAPVKKDMGEFFQTLGSFYATSGWLASLKQLDRTTFRDYLVSERNWSPELFRLMVPELAAFFGFPDAVSAAAVYAHYASSAPRYIYAFPGGNGGLARHLVKSLIPESFAGRAREDGLSSCPLEFAALDRPGKPVRLRLNSTALAVEHEGSAGQADHVRVTFSHAGVRHRVRARAAILAGGGFVTPWIARDMPAGQRQAYAEFVYAPVLWANVLLNNSRALDKAGLNFLSTYLEGFGVLLIRYEKMTARAEAPDSRPAVLGVGCPRFYPGLPPREQEAAGKKELLETTFREYERRIREDLARVLGPWGFDPQRDIEAITLHRWAHHGYAFGYPGFFFGSAVETARKPYGRVALAHTDLHRFSLVMGAIEQGRRAAREALERI